MKIDVDFEKQLIIATDWLPEDDASTFLGTYQNEAYKSENIGDYPFIATIGLNNGAEVSLTRGWEFEENTKIELISRGFRYRLPSVDKLYVPYNEKVIK